MRWIATSVLVLLGLAVPVTARAGGPVTRMVDGDGLAAVGDCDASDPAFSTIQAAVDASGPGDIVLVCPGRYRPVSIQGHAKDGLTLRAVEAWRSTIVVRTERRDFFSTFGNPIGVAVRNTSDVLVEDFRIRVARGSAPGCYAEALIAFRRSSGEVVGNKLVGRRGSCAEARVGIMTIPREADDHLVVRANLVRNYGGAGIEMIDFDEIGLGTFHAFGNTIQRLRPGRLSGIGIGIFAFGGASANIHDNTVLVAADAPIPQGITINGTTADVRRNIVDGANLGLFGSDASGVWAGNRILRGKRGILTAFLEGLEIARNRVTGMTRAGIRVGQGSRDLHIHDNDFRGNGRTDCIDETRGSGTAGTRNLWQRNRGDESDPVGICQPVL